MVTVEAAVAGRAAARQEGEAMVVEPMMRPDDRLLLTLWSAPRSRSTAFERMMIERGDITVLHEPFSHVKDFGQAEVAGRRVTGEAELLAALRALGGHTFLKDTTDFHYPEMVADHAFLRGAVHAFIIRHPREVIASHARLNPDLQCDEIGFERLYEIYCAVTAATGRRPLVIDSDELLARPADVISNYCRQVGIRYVPEALRWQPGTPSSWRRTERWHRAASDSSGFGPRAARPAGAAVALEPRLAAFCDYHLPYYQKLRENKMRLP
jgi:hypothetical protein